MLNFFFPYHRTQTEYPESSIGIKFGRGYQFVSRPIGPDQLIYRLSFSSMFFVTTVAGVPHRGQWSSLNVLAMEDFYRQHQLYEKFLYAHPTDGMVVVRFNKPLTIPKPVEGQSAVYNTLLGEPASVPMKIQLAEPFEISLITQP